jgi:hypothetical protein
MEKTRVNLKKWRELRASKRKVTEELENAKKAHEKIAWAIQAKKHDDRVNFVCAAVRGLMEYGVLDTEYPYGYITIVVDEYHWTVDDIAKIVDVIESSGNTCEERELDEYQIKQTIFDRGERTWLIRNYDIIQMQKDESFSKYVTSLDNKIRKTLIISEPDEEFDDPTDEENEKGGEKDIE